MKIEERLKEILKGKVVIAGIGNILRGDDGFGPLFVNSLKNTSDFICIDCGTAPENYIGKVIKEKPDTVLLVDAVHLNAACGSYELLKKEDILPSGFTTHDLSPNMLIEILEKETNAVIYLLGIQPKNVTFGSEISEEVKNSLNLLVSAINEVEKCMKHT
ncbi:MAG: hydrogenase 3 maturation endopeptidase HyCI [Candidatus Omnitrophota bacterium]